MRVTFHTFPGGWPYAPPSWWKYYRNQAKLAFPSAFLRGLQSQGLAPRIGKRWEPSDDADIAVIWGWKRPNIIAAMLSTGRNVLVMERGFIQPRHEWCSLAINGLNGRGLFAPAGDTGERWNQYFAHHLRPWRRSPGDYALLIGQVPGDAALHGADIVTWAQVQTERLRRLGLRVIYRPHPQLPTPCPAGADLSSGTLAEDFAGADRVVCFSSTTAVESILAGIPTVVTDPGSVAYSMASHDVAEPLIRPDRTVWCHNLAWRQWSLAELADGTAWRHIRQIVRLPSTIVAHGISSESYPAAATGV